MATPTQNRHISIGTPLGEDVLLLRGFEGHEEVSRLSSFELDLLSEDGAIKFDDIVGKNATIALQLPGGGARYWNGYISRFTQTSTVGTQFAEYRATMVPWLWFLTQTVDSRIFQKMTVPDILVKIFDDLGFTDYEDRLSGGYRTWEYCVQYRETDFDFVSRLMEQEGIYYYFAHENGSHKLVLCDSLSKHDPYEDYSEIMFVPSAVASELQERITDWTIEHQVRPGKYVHTDYNFQKPKTALPCSKDDVKKHANASYEVYEYPGEYGEKADGNRYADIRMEELAQPHELCKGEGESRGIATGYVFALSGSPRPDQDREYLVLSAETKATCEGYETAQGPTEDAYLCGFTVMPSDVQYRPERTTPKPLIHGAQRAVVTGPAGEEIWPDDYGRVKIQFYWDREGQYDENSSCWVRVSQVHAGKSFGAIDIPRIGEEVLVGFIGGDPDQPIIVGRVYNDDQKVPFGLPDNKVVSGMKSNSTKGGAGYNEITMNDTKGNEDIVIHAQYNMNTTVENDQNRTVHNNRTTTVDVDDTETVGNNQTISVGVDQKTDVGANQTLSVGANQDQSIGADRSVTVGGSETTGISADRTLNVGASESISVGADRKVNVGAGLTIAAGANLDASAGANMGLVSSANTDISAGVNINLAAGASITITAGGSSIKIDGGGITLSTGGMIKELASMIQHNT